jgi:hypothetical protein
MGEESLLKKIAGFYGERVDANISDLIDKAESTAEIVAQHSLDIDLVKVTFKAMEDYGEDYDDLANLSQSVDNIFNAIASLEGTIRPDSDYIVDICENIHSWSWGSVHVTELSELVAKFIKIDYAVEASNPAPHTRYTYTSPSGQSICGFVDAFEKYYSNDNVDTIVNAALAIAEVASETVFSPKYVECIAEKFAEISNSDLDYTSEQFLKLLLQLDEFARIHKVAPNKKWVESFFDSLYEWNGRNNIDAKDLTTNFMRIINSDFTPRSEAGTQYEIKYSGPISGKNTLLEIKDELSQKNKCFLHSARRIGVYFVTLVGAERLYNYLSDPTFNVNPLYMLSAAAGLAAGTFKRYSAPTLAFLGSIGPELYQSTISLMNNVPWQNVVAEQKEQVVTKLLVATVAYGASRIINKE